MDRVGGVRLRRVGMAIGIAAAVGCGLPPPATPLPADAPMSVDEVRTLLAARRAAGEKLTGYGKTVFEGTRVERFDIEVLAVLPTFLPKQDLILVRARHPILDRGGIIAGMSGSPVYVHDKVIGAIGYGWSFSKEPIAGVTPIHAMLAELKRPLERRAEAQPTVPLERAPVERVRTPLLSAGLGARALAALESDLAPWGFLPLQAGGGGADDGGAALEPGSAIGVPLLEGDAHIAAVGTLSYRDGDRLLAFGHPFFNAGEITFPMTTAVVHAVLPSLAMPFKLASPGREVGALVQDRTSCVAGRLGTAPARIPLQVTIRSPGAKEGERFRYRVAQHELLTPAIVRTAVLGAVDAHEPGMERNTLNATTTIRLRGIGPVVVRNTYANQGHTFNAAILQAFSHLFNNPFEKPVVEGIDIDLDVRHEERLAEIRSVWPDEDEIEAGQTARLNVSLRVRHGRDELRRIDLPIPPGLHHRELTVRVTGGSDVDPEAPPPTNLRELAAALQAPYPSTHLMAVLTLPTTDLRYHGRVLDRIPNSILGPLVPGLVDRALLTSSSLRIGVPTDWVIQGAAEVRLRVK
jgi:hypothetical protein